MVVVGGWVGYCGGWGPFGSCGGDGWMEVDEGSKIWCTTNTCPALIYNWLVSRDKYGADN